MQHRPVLLAEVIQHLAIRPDGIYIDGTFGRGGHATEILRQLGPNGRLIAFDKDPDAIQAASEGPWMHDPRFTLQQGAFTTLLAQVKQRDWVGNIDGILLDLGVSSPQLDDPMRGFSFLRDGPLDMRMDKAQPISAKDWVNSAPIAEITHVLKEFGEERFAARIAKAIVFSRQQTPITRTGQLADIVAKAHPRWEPHKHPATRTFQAIRIFINSELTELQTVLEQALTVLKTGGRLVVITFHSLEDRIVKKFVATHNSSALPPGLPLTHAEVTLSIRIRNIGGAIRPSEQEISENVRARSATLRVMEKQ